MGSGGALRLVEKSIEVLDLLAEHGELTIAELANLTEEPRSSLYRLVGSLEQLELVEPGGSRGQIRLGMHLLRLGVAVQASIDIRGRALPVMEALREQTGLTVYLLVRRDRQAVCVERLEGRRVASLVLKLGGALPLHTGAAPRALLAFDAEDAWRGYAEGSTLEEFTAQTLSDPDQLYKILAEDRVRGYTVSDGDVNPGIAALGAPVFDHSGAIHAAISVSGLRDEVLGPSEVRDTVVESAEAISRAMGYSATS